MGDASQSEMIPTQLVDPVENNGEPCLIFFFIQRSVTDR